MKNKTKKKIENRSPKRFSVPTCCCLCLHGSRLNCSMKRRKKEKYNEKNTPRSQGSDMLIIRIIVESYIVCFPPPWHR